jgi:uncharacterized protein
MKLWQVDGKDLREVNREALADEQRLADWIVNGGSGEPELEWTVVGAELPVPAPGKSPGKSADSPFAAATFDDTRARAREGDAAAQAALGFMCELGIDTPVDCAQAVNWYRKAADRGNPRAQLILRQIASVGFLYERRRMPPMDRDAAVEMCCTAAEEGNARAQFHLAQMYEWGEGMPRDLREAAQWYRQAAEQGSAAAQFQLGQIYCDGYGVPQNTAEAVKWWETAALNGDAAAQFKLGLCFCNGQGVPQDYTEAVKWYREAAEQGDVEAQGKLGDAYYIGLGVAANFAEAVKWYREAAEHGNASAQRHLGIMYGLGQGVPRDNVEALKWYDLAAAQNDSNAIYNRKTISASMTPGQIDDARRLSHEFAARRQSGAMNGMEAQGASLKIEPANGQLAIPAGPVAASRGKAVLGIDLLLIGSQMETASGGTIDLLAIDAQANLVVIALKREKAPSELLAQTLDHASWVNALSHREIDAIAKNFTRKALDEAFTGHFGAALPQTVNASHSILILASDWDDSTERIVRYLAREHGVPIQVIFLAVFKTASGEFLGRVRG